MTAHVYGTGFANVFRRNEINREKNIPPDQDTFGAHETRRKAQGRNEMRSGPRELQFREKRTGIRKGNSSQYSVHRNSPGPTLNKCLLLKA